MIGTGIFTLSGGGPDLVTTDRFVVARIVRPSLLDSAAVQRIGGHNPNTGDIICIGEPRLAAKLRSFNVPPIWFWSVWPRLPRWRQSAAYLHPLPPRCKASWGIRPGRSPHLDCHRNAHPLGSLRQLQITVGRWPKWPSSCLLCLGVSGGRPIQTSCRALGPPPSWFSPTFADAVLLVLFAMPAGKMPQMWPATQNSQRNVPLVPSAVSPPSPWYLLVNCFAGRASLRHD